MELAVGLWILCGIVGAIIGSQKNAGCMGAVVGFMLGPLGILAVCFIDKRSTCPHCGGRWTRETVDICPHCRTNIIKMRHDSAKSTQSQLDAEAYNATKGLVDSQEADYVERLRSRRR